MTYNRYPLNRQHGIPGRTRETVLPDAIAGCELRTTDFTVETHSGSTVIALIGSVQFFLANTEQCARVLYVSNEKIGATSSWCLLYCADETERGQCHRYFEMI
jgi:hypothetical protein